MEKDQALRIFNELEERKYIFGEELFPRFSVRLDASGNNDLQREYRLFVRIAPGAPAEDSEEQLRYVLNCSRESEKAHSHELALENDGISIT